MVKEGLRVTTQQGVPCQDAIQSRLFVYHTTPYSDTILCSYVWHRVMKKIVLRKNNKLNDPVNQHSYYAGSNGS